jgi:peptidase M48-like protein
MNKIYLKYGFVALFFVSLQASMPALMFRGAQIVGSGYCISKGLNEAYQRNGNNKGPIIGIPVPPRAAEWFRQELMLLNLHKESQNMPLLCLPKNNPGSWEVEGNRCVRASIDDIALLNKALECRENKENEFLWNFGDDSVTLNPERIIAINTAWLKHEIGHYIHKDNKRSMHQHVWVPLAVQAACSGMSYGFNRLCKIGPPTTIPMAMARSAIAIASIVPKSILIKLCYSRLCRNQERKADTFACENAATRFELEAWQHWFKCAAQEFEQAILGYSDPQNVKDTLYVRFQHASYDPWHPFFAERAAMIQTHLDKWDAEHKSE